MKTYSPKKLEILRKIFLISLVIFVISFLISLALVIIGSNFGNNFTYTPKYVGYMFIIMGMSGASMLVLNKKIYKPLKMMLMESVAKASMKEGKYFPSMGIVESDFKKSEFIKTYDKYVATDALVGATNTDQKFYMCNIEVNSIANRGTSEEESTILLKGVFGILDKTERIASDINIIPDVKNKYLNQVFTNMKKMLGAKDVVRLENLEFERYFEVYSENQIEARKKLTVNFMEKLLQARKNIDCDMYLSYKGSRAYFFIANGEIIKTNKLMLTGVSDKVVEENNKNMKLIIEAIESL